MQKTFITKNSEQTQKLGALLSEEFKAGGIVCLTGDLGAGKTTFVQGFLQGLGVEGPYTSPTFLIMKEYKRENPKSKIQNIYHLDAYRVDTADVLNLGWEEMVANPQNIIIIEWAKRIRKIIPSNSLWIDLEWQGEEERQIIFQS